MNDATSISVALNTVDEVLPALPHLLGFYPAESLVIVTMYEHLGGKAQLGPTLRADLPTAEEYEEFVSYLVAGLHPMRADALMLFVVTGTGTGCVDSLPHGGLVGQLTDALDMVRTPVEHALWTPGIRHGAEWISYLTPGLRGTVGDPRASVLGAALATQGSAPFASRDALRALIAPERGGATAAEWAVKLDGLSLDDSAESVAERTTAIEGAIAGIAAGQYPGEDALLRMLRWISDVSVRDALVPTVFGEHPAAAQDLWTTLVRKAPAPELADVAALLAISTYVRGETVLAQIALDRALDAVPDHTLASLLRTIADSGIPPVEFEQFLQITAEQ